MSVAQFSVRLRQPFENFFGAGARYTPVPQWWTDMANGGPDAAQITLEGHADALIEGLKMLNWDVEIFSSLGHRVWWGYVNEVEVNFGGTNISLSLDSVYNAVQVAYVIHNPDGSIERATTAWAEDERSIDRYGRREVLLSLTDGGESAALKYRDRILAQAAKPLPTTQITGDANVAATLYCRGHYYKMARRYYKELRGLEEYIAGGSGTQATGNYYERTTISFEAPDKIKDSGNGFTALLADQRVYVSGASNAENNEWHTIESVDSAGQITTSGKQIVNESAGSDIMLATSTPFSVGIAQAFTLEHTASDNWQARRVAIQAQRVGAVADNLLIDIRADVAGEPSGTALATATITGSTMSENMTWIEATLDTGVTLTGATQYWVVVYRSAYWDGASHSARLGQHYVVNVNEGLTYPRGDMLLADEVGWFERDPDAQMPFRVLGLLENSDQMSAIVADSELSGTDMEVETGIETWQYRDGDRTHLDEIESLIAIGTSTSTRMLARVQPDRTVRVIEKPTPNDGPSLVMRANGHVQTFLGQDLEPGQLIAGRYVYLDFLPLLDAIGPGDTLFIERSRYDAKTGKVTFETEGNTSAWDIGVLPG